MTTIRSTKTLMKLPLHEELDLSRRTPSEVAESLAKMVYPGVATVLRESGMTDAEIDTAVQTLLAMLVHEPEKVDDPAAWFVARLREVLADNLRRRGIEPAAADPAAEKRLLVVLVRTELGRHCLAPSVHRAIRMFFREQRSLEDIASELNVTLGYARKLISGGLGTLKQLIREAGGR